MSMEPFSAVRRFPRVSADAAVLYSDARESGRARLCDISRGGLGIREATTPLSPGRWLPVTISIGLNRVGPFSARVVWSDSDRAGLEVDWTDPAVERQVSQAMRYLQPLT